MKAIFKKELETAIRSPMPLGEIVGLLRQYKKQGISQREVYSFLEVLHEANPDEATDDRILEVSDFVAGFCASGMKIWDGSLLDKTSDDDNPSTQSRAS